MAYGDASSGVLLTSTGAPPTSVRRDDQTSQLKLGQTGRNAGRREAGIRRDGVDRAVLGDGVINTSLPAGEIQCAVAPRLRLAESELLLPDEIGDELNGVGGCR